MWLKLKIGSKGDEKSNTTTIEVGLYTAVLLYLYESILMLVCVVCLISVGLQVHIDYSKAKYKTPHLALLQAWVLEPQYVQQPTGTGAAGNRKIQETRVQALTLPPPR